MALDLIFHDENLLVVNKPSGLLTIRDGYDPNLPSVRSLIEQEFGTCYIVHRLDKETSGVLLIALNRETHRQLNLSFQNREIKKEYHALISGIPDQTHLVIDQPLKVNFDRKHRTRVDIKDGKPAMTVVNLLTSFEVSSLVSIEPRTGYTHQIRSHLSFIGHPILGDGLYTLPNLPFPADDKVISRTALHAYRITFSHPITHEELTFCAPYPDDFRSAIEQLK